MTDNTSSPPPTFIEALFYSGKAAISGVLAVLCFDFLHLQGAMWAAISAVIVTQPGLHPSVRASLMRVIANIIGACVGALFGALIGHTLYGLAAGVVVTGLVCYLTGLEEAVRPAYAAVVILILNPGPGSTWFSSLERVYAVIIGCLVSLLVGFVFDKSTRRFGLGPKPAAPSVDCE